MTEIMGVAREHVAWQVVACLGFGLFWGTSYVHYSGTLSDLGLTTFVEVLTRGLSCAVCALVIWKARRVTRGMCVGIAALLAGWVAIRLGGLGSSDIASLAGSIFYGLWTGGVLAWWVLALYGFSRAALTVVVPIGFAVSYAYGMAAAWGGGPVALNALAGLISLAALVALLMFNRALAPDSAPDDGPSVTSEAPGCRVSSTTDRGGASGAVSLPFMGAIVLHLVLMGMWFRLGAESGGPMWLLEVPVGFGCVAVLLAMIPVMLRSRGVAFMQRYAVFSFCALLVSLLLSALFWDNAPLYIKEFAGVWFATFQAVMFVCCGAEEKRVGRRVLMLGIAQGATLLLLAAGNVVEPLLFPGNTYDRTMFLAVSFAFAVALAVLVALDVYRLMTRGVRSAGEAESADARRGDAARGDWSAALERVCRSYGVSQREEQVLESFSRGRSTAYIADELSLSEATVRTHLKRAYAKMDVHSRQELLDVIEKECGMG